MNVTPLIRIGSPVLSWRNPRANVDRLAARARERWDLERMREYQIARLRALCAHAFETVPLHRERMLAAAMRPDDIRDLTDLAYLPPLAKDELREALADGRALSRAFAPRELVIGTTTGSTGTPLRFAEDRRCLWRRRALLARGERWIGHAGWKRTTRLWRRYESHGAADRRRIARGLLQWIPVTEVTRPVESAMGNAALAAVATEVARFDPHIVRGYVSALVALARHVVRAGDDRIRPQRVVCSAEYLGDAERALLTEAFGCPVHNLYGASEAPMIAVNAAGETSLTAFSDYYHLEILPSREGEPGRLLVTDLLNRAMPLIRYEIGDLAELDPIAHGPFPRLRAVHGRVNDVFVLPDGRRVFSHVWHIYFRDLRSVDRFTVVQTDPDRIEVTFVIPDGRMDPGELARVRALVTERFPGIRFSWRETRRAAAEIGDKHRAVRSLVTSQAA